MAVYPPITTAIALALSLGLVGVNSVSANTGLDRSKVELHQEQTPAAVPSTAPQASAETTAEAAAEVASHAASSAASNPANNAPQTAVEPAAAAPDTAASAAEQAPSADPAERTYEGSMVKARPRYRDPFGNRITEPLSVQLPKKEVVSGSSYGTTSPNANQINFPQIDLDHSRVAVVYFSVSEQIESNDVDELTGASVIYNRKHERSGITQYVAELIGEQTHGALFLISRLSPYSHDHDELIYQASLELDDRKHPEIVMLPPLDLKAYDVIFIGYPIWWYELPMPLYSFFEQYDLSGKIVVPFCTHGGSRAYKTFALIAQQEPNAYVMYNDGLIIDRLVVPTHAESTVELWLKAVKDRLNHKISNPVGFDLDRHSPIIQQTLEQANLPPLTEPLPAPSPTNAPASSPAPTEPSVPRPSAP